MAGLLVEVLVAADRYMMAGLRSLCQQRLADSLAASPTVLRLCDVLRAAYLMDSAPLRQVSAFSTTSTTKRISQ